MAGRLVKLDNDGISLEVSVVAFIDVLGTRSADADQVVELNRLIAARERASEMLQAEPAYDLVGFTDNTVLRWHAQFGDEVNPALAWIPDELAAFQLAFATEGVLVRGAVETGMLAIGDQIVFGDGLNRSYEGETRRAFWPRIVLSGDVVELVRDAAASADDEDLDSLDAILRDEDGSWFVHYLKWSERSGAAGFYLQKHRDWLLSRIAEQRANAAVMEKLRWSVDYHNHASELLGQSAAQISGDDFRRDFTTA